MQDEAEETEEDEEDDDDEDDVERGFLNDAWIQRKTIQLKHVPTPVPKNLAEIDNHNHTVKEN